LTNKLNEGVGKKIVEALKKQSEGTLEENIELSANGTDGLIPNVDETINQELTENTPIEVSENDTTEALEEEITIVEEDTNKEELIEEKEILEEKVTPIEIAESIQQEAKFDDSVFTNNSINDMFFDNHEKEQISFNSFSTENTTEIPSNIAILKKLISQLPSGVTRHTGAQIIKQTMEALGISMKSVLKEAQEAQESLKESAKECQVNIQECKRKIIEFDKQSQNYQKQYNALNDLISLFIQTTK